MDDIDLTRSVVGAQPFRPSPLSAVQYIRKMRGQTQAHLMRASDDNLYVTKFQNNPDKSRVLAGEFLATRLGLWLGLPMPQVEVIEVPEWLVNHALLRIEDGARLTRCASGRQLAFRYMPDALESLPKGSFDQVTNREDFIRVLPFDKWTGNCDNRQVVFVKEGKQYRAILIDQHQAFDAGRWRFPDLPHHGIYEHRYIYRNVSGWQWFEPTLSRITKLSRFDLWKFATEIPPEWYGHHTESLSRLIERLYRRRGSIRDLITRLRYSANNPFPNWPTQ
jgi:hypothetical protein